MRPLADEQVPLDRVEYAREARHGARFNTDRLFRELDAIHMTGQRTSVEDRTGGMLSKLIASEAVEQTRGAWDSVAVGLSYLASDLRAGGVI